MAEDEFKIYLTKLEENTLFLVDNDTEKATYEAKVKTYIRLITKLNKELDTKRQATSAGFRQEYETLMNQMKGSNLQIPDYLHKKLIEESEMGKKLNMVIKEAKSWTKPNMLVNFGYYQFVMRNYNNHSSFDQVVSDELTKLDEDEKLLKSLKEDLKSIFFDTQNNWTKPDIDRTAERLKLDHGL